MYMYYTYKLYYRVHLNTFQVVGQPILWMDTYYMYKVMKAEDVGLQGKRESHADIC
jgi:hypothetical protein